MRGPERQKTDGDKPQVPGTQLGLGLGSEPPLPADGTSVISKPKVEKVGKDTSQFPVIPAAEPNDDNGTYDALRERRRAEMAAQPGKDRPNPSPRTSGRSRGR